MAFGFKEALMMLRLTQGKIIAKGSSKSGQPEFLENILQW